MGYLSSINVTMKSIVGNVKDKKVNFFKSQIFYGCRNLLVVYKQNFSVSNLHLDFSLSAKTSYLNGMCFPDGLKAMWKSKDYNWVFKVLSFIRTLIDSTSEYKNEQQLTVVHTLWSDVVTKYCWQSSRNWCLRASVLELETKICGLNKERRN